MRTKLTPQDIEQVLTRYQAGDSARNIARTMGRTTAGILLVLRRHGVKQRVTKARRVDLDEAAICEDYKTLPFTALEAKYGADQNVLTRILKRNGVKLRARGRQFSQQPVLDTTGALQAMTCEHCGKEKPADAFPISRGRKYGLHYVCRDCERWRSREIKYGITREAYDAMYVAQEGRCKICGGTDSNEVADFVVDHDHKTGQVRGLLCPRCNHMLGHAKDSPEILEKGAAYLRAQPT